MSAARASAAPAAAAIALAVLLLAAAPSGAAILAPLPARVAPASDVPASVAGFAEDLAQGGAGGAFVAARRALAEGAAHLPGPSAQAQRDLDLAQALFQAPGADAPAIAALASAWQAESLGVLPTALPAPAPGSPGPVHDLAAAIAARQGLGLGADQTAAVLALDALAEDLRAPLARILVAYIGMAEATDAAFAGADVAAFSARLPDRAAMPAVPAWDAPPALAIEARDHGIDLALIVPARLAFLAATLDLQRALEGSPQAAAAAPLDVPGALSIDLGTADNTYTAHYALQVDAGGNDKHLNNAGGSTLKDQVCDDNLALETAGAGALVDFAGNDLYEDAASPCPWGMNGGAYLGSGFLYDAAGSDTYRGGLIVNGAGYLGSGFLLDAGGNDTYRAWSFVSNGGAYEGTGKLLDLGAGNDTYTGLYGWTNGGAAEGLGLLIDGGGSDRYLSVGGFGNGGGAGYGGAGFLADLGGDDVYTEYGGASNGGGFYAGAGFLFDAAGNDSYLSPTFSGSATNGGGFSAAVGMLIDLAGNDYYLAKCGVANGGGLFLGAGFLLDLAGNDRYITYLAVSNGGGIQGSGFLLDAGGNDLYQGGYGAVNGGATDAGSGLLLDLGGNDAYVAKSIGVNGGTSTSPYFTPLGCAQHPVSTLCMPFPLAKGLLVDVGGTDSYSDNEGGTGTDKTVAPKGTLGLQLDLALPAAP